MNTISRTYTFCAAHRIEGHPKCGRLHGHNYRVEVSITGDADRATGMVMDYANLDTIVKPLIDQFDHRYIVSRKNVEAGDPYADIAAIRGDTVAPDIDHSTAECLSQWFARAIAHKMTLVNVYSVWVDVQETDRSHASAGAE